MLARDDCVTGIPSRYHDTTGVGVPIARHGKTAIDFNGSVWFEGPCRMIGGGRSSCVLMANTTRLLTLPTLFTALHTIILPESTRCTFDSERTLRPSGVRVISMLSYLEPGNINVRLPSIDQNNVGLG